MNNAESEFTDYKILKGDSGFFKENKKMIQYAVNGFSRVLILWIIKYNKSIHGYAIMKELDKFFTTLIDEGIIKKSSSSKVYPILKSMEDTEIIEGIWKTQENKKVKYYSITDKGLLLLNEIRKKHLSISKYPQWNLFFNDFYLE